LNKETPHEGFWLVASMKSFSISIKFGCARVTLERTVVDNLNVAVETMTLCSYFYGQGWWLFCLVYW